MLGEFMRIVTVVAAIGTASGAVAQDVAAQWPTRPITIIVPYAPGGVASTYIQIQGDYLEKILGQPIIIENTPGGGGIVAAVKVGRAEPDGYTWLSMQSGLATITPHLHQDYDPDQSLTLVATSRTSPMMIVVRTDSPYRSLQDILDDAKARPGEVSYASLGVGSLHHIIGETLQKETGVLLNHVPYSGGAQYLVDLIAGRVDFAMSTQGSMAGYPDQLRPIVTAQQDPTPMTTDVPTAASAGLAMDLPSWVGISVPKGTPQPIVDKIDAALKLVDEDPDFRAAYARLGTETFYVSGKEYWPQVMASSARIHALLTELGLAIK